MTDDRHQVLDARHPELERRITEDPYDHEAFSIYADWLQQQGDPRGELVALHTELELLPDRAVAADQLRAAASAYLAQHADYLLGPLRAFAGEVADAPIPFGWRHGFIQHVELDAEDGPVAPVLEALLRHPSGRFVTELELELAERSDAREAIAALANLITPSLRGLTISAWHDLGDLGGIWPRAPRLQRLAITAPAYEVGALRTPEVMRARFRGAALSPGCVHAISSAPWPALEALLLRCGRAGAPDQRARFLDLATLFGRDDLPSLTRLALPGCAFGSEICRALPSSPIAATLQRLDLSFSIATRIEVEQLAAARQQLPALQQLIVPGAGFIDEPQRDRLRSLGLFVEQPETTDGFAMLDGAYTGARR